MLLTEKKFRVSKTICTRGLLNVTARKYIFIPFSENCFQTLILEQIPQNNLVQFLIFYSEKQISMKILQMTQKQYAFMGISITFDSLERPFNVRNTAFSIMLDCAYILLALMSGSLGFFTIVWKMANLFEFINDLEEIVNSSKCHSVKAWTWKSWFSNPILWLRTIEKSIFEPYLHEIKPPSGEMG